MSDEGGETIAEARRVETGTSRAVVVFSTLAFVGLVADLWSKHVAFDPNFVPGPRRPIAGGWATFELTTSFNEGALFGVGQGWTWLFALLSLVAVAAWVSVALTSHTVNAVQALSLVAVAAVLSYCAESHTVKAVQTLSLMAVAVVLSYCDESQTVKARQTRSLVVVAAVLSY